MTLQTLIQEVEDLIEVRKSKGNFGHAGVPGHRGGSAPKSGGNIGALPGLKNFTEDYHGEKNAILDDAIGSGDAKKDKPIKVFRFSTTIADAKKGLTSNGFKKLGKSEGNKFYNGDTGETAKVLPSRKSVVIYHSVYSS